MKVREITSTPLLTMQIRFNKSVQMKHDENGNLLLEIGGVQPLEIGPVFEAIETSPLPEHIRRKLAAGLEKTADEITISEVLISSVIEQKFL